MTIDEKLLDKIKKVLALSASSNPHEAAVALEKATAMMAEHNLTMKDIDRSQIGRAEIKSSQSVSKAKDWEVAFFQMVGQAFGCKVLFRAGRSKDPDYWARYIFIGEKVNVQLAEYTAIHLSRVLLKGRSDFYRKLSDHGWKRGNDLTAELDGFCKGWIQTVSSKVHAFANDTNLQVVIDDYIKELTKSRPTTQAHNRGTGAIGGLAGKEAAASVTLNRPMDRDEQKKIGT